MSVTQVPLATSAVDPGRGEVGPLCDLGGFACSGEKLAVLPHLNPLPLGEEGRSIRLEGTRRLRAMGHGRLACGRRARARAWRSAIGRWLFDGSLWMRPSLFCNRLYDTVNTFYESKPGVFLKTNSWDSCLPANRYIFIRHVLFHYPD